MKTTRLDGWTRWAPLLALTATLAGCGAAVTPTADAPAPTPPPAEPLATCTDSAIRLLGRGAGIHGAIVADTLHMGGAEAPVTCAEPANLSLEAGLSVPDDWTAQAQQSQSRYYLIVIRYPGGNRLYVISRRADGSTCIVDTNDRCIAQVTELPDDFDLQDLPDDVAPTIPAGRPAPELPAATAPAAAGNPQPRDGAAGVAVETLLLSWSAAARAASYDVYWGTGRNLAADADLGTPIATTSTATTIRRPGATAAERRLALGTTYYWRVDTKNDRGTTRGNVWSFTTADQAAPPPPGGGGYTPPAVSPPPAVTGTPPGAASTPQPRHGATGVAVETLLLSWSAAARAASYDVYWGTGRNLAADADLGTPIGTTFTATTIRRPALGTTYYWRVDAKNDQGTTTGSVWSFTTADRAAPPPVAPGGGYTPPAVSPPPATGPRPGTASNPQPSDGATGVTTFGPLLNWAAPPPSAGGFGLYLGASQDLAVDKLIYSVNHLTDGIFFRREDTERRHYIPWEKNLANGTTYYWRVDRWNENGTTRGPVWSFTTAEVTGELPGVSSNPQPSDGATAVIPSGWHPGGFGRDSIGDSLLVTWDPAPRRGLGYLVYVGTSRDLSSGTVSSSPFSAGICVRHCSEKNRGKGIALIWADELSYGTTYYWRADAKNENGITRGNVWSFTTCATKPHVRADGVGSCPRVETEGDSED